MHVYVCASEKARAGGAGGAQQHAARPRPTPKAAPASTPRSPHAPRPGAQCPFVGCTPSSLCTRAADRARLCALQGPPGRNAPRHSPRYQSRPLWRHPSAAGAPSLPFPARSARIGGMTRHPTATTQHTRALGSDVRRSRTVKAHSRATRKRIRRDSRALPCIPADPAPSRASHATLPPQRVPTRTAWRASRPEGARGAQSTGEAPATASLSCILALPPDALGQQSRHSHACHILTGLPIARPETDPGRAPTWAAAPAPGRALPPPLWRPVRVAWSCAPRRGPWCCGSA